MKVYLKNKWLEPRTGSNITLEIYLNKARKYIETINRTEMPCHDNALNNKLSMKYMDDIG